MQKSWLNRPYYSIGDFYRKRFGESVYKVSVNVADTCPNRMGLKGMQTCTFCDVWGSAAYSDQRNISLDQQILNVQEKIKNKSNAKKFVVYFQSYTNSFMAISKLKAMYEEALKYPNIVGIVVGTRPDCISEGLLKLWESFSKKTYFSVELGAQSFYKDYLEFEKRGHSAQDTINAVLKIAKIPSIDIGLHFIFGHPGEKPEYAFRQAQFVSQLPIHNVKLHNLHVLKNTKLEKFYEAGLFRPIDLESYSELVGAFLKGLRDDIPVQRLSALSSRWDELIAPDWTKHKMTIFQAIIDYLHKNKIYQSQLYKSKNEGFIVPEDFNSKILDQNPFDDLLKKYKEPLPAEASALS